MGNSIGIVKAHESNLGFRDLVCVSCQIEGGQNREPSASEQPFSVNFDPVSLDLIGIRPKMVIVGTQTIEFPELKDTV